MPQIVSLQLIYVYSGLGYFARIIKFKAISILFKCNCSIIYYPHTQMSTPTRARIMVNATIRIILFLLYMA